MGLNWNDVTLKKREKNSGGVQQLRCNVYTSPTPIKHFGSTHEHAFFLFFLLSFSFFLSFFVAYLLYFLTYLLTLFTLPTYLPTYLPNYLITYLLTHSLTHLPTYLSLYLPTYLLIPWSRALLEKLTGFQLVKKFPAFYGTRRFIAAFTSARYLSLSSATSIQSMTSHLISRRSILILSSHLHLGLPTALSLRFPGQNYFVFMHFVWFSKKKQRKH